MALYFFYQEKVYYCKYNSELASKMETKIARERKQQIEQYEITRTNYKSYCQEKGSLFEWKMAFFMGRLTENMVVI